MKPELPPDVEQDAVCIGYQYYPPKKKARDKLREIIRIIRE